MILGELRLSAINYLEKLHAMSSIANDIMSGDDWVLMDLIVQLIEHINHMIGMPQETHD